MIYTELLDILNKFMDKSGIREYCKTQCKPKQGDGCCDGRYQSKTCEPTCQEQLVCVSYTCHKSIKVLPEKQRRALNEINNIILDWAIIQFGNPYLHNYDIETVKNAEININKEALEVIQNAILG